MEILKDLNQIYDKLNEVFNLDNEIDFTSQNFLFEIKDKAFLDNMSTQIKNKNLSQEKCQQLYDYIFQLKNYIPAICNLIHLYLLSKKYEEVYSLTNKIFVSHFGNNYYSSKNNINSKNFDRLVEIVNTANIDTDVFIEFILFIQNSNLHIFDFWKQPSLEYLQNLYNTNDKFITNFIEKQPNLKYDMLKTTTYFNSLKGIEFLIDDYVNNKNCDFKQNLSILKEHKNETLKYIDALLSKTLTQNQIPIVNILLEMSSDSEVMSRIQDIYSTSKNKELNNLISEKLGISATMNIHTEKQFLYSARRKIKEPQERSLGVAFSKFNLKTKSGIPADNIVYSFIIFLFKEEKSLNNLYKLKILENIFNKESLEDFAFRLFETLQRKNDILQSKWCVRFFALFVPQNKIDWTFDFIIQLLNQQRNKEAKYLITALIFSKKTEVIDLLNLCLAQNLTFIKENIDDFIKNISTCLKLHEDDIRDMLVPNEFSLGEFDIQRDRLFNSFIAGKMYTKSIFDNLFIENKIYNKLAQNLVFGEYKQGHLCNAFIIKDDKIEFIIGETIFNNNQTNSEILIGIIHPLDCDYKYDKIFSYFSEPTFNQFKPARFNVKENTQSSNVVQKFMGVMINPQSFTKYIFSKGFRPNKKINEDYFKSVIHIFPSLNLICELEFSKPIFENDTYNSLEGIYFYKISETLESENKFLTQKNNALAISSIPARYYNYVLTTIYEGSKM